MNHYLNKPIKRHLLASALAAAAKASAGAVL
jgi:hypothetical protein